LIHSGGTGIDPEWHRDYLKNRLARLSDTDRQEFERLTALRDGAAGADRAELQSRLMKISRKIDVFDPAFADALPTFDEYPISDEVNRLLCADWQAYMRDPPFRDSVFNLTMPVLFFDGAGDVQPAKFIAALADSIAGSRLVIVPQAGHHTWVEQPAFVRAALREFVASLP
jgi:pimeloyl-ACP methyl ester carboxylesterase